MYLDKLRNYELKYSVNDYIDGSTELHTSVGNIPILISSPHSTKHYRNNLVKSQDLFTGSIGEVISHVLDCHFISRGNLQLSDDYYFSFVKDFVNKHKILAMIEMHGMSYKRQSDVDICINNGTNLCGDVTLLNCLCSGFTEYNICYTIDEYFKADKDYCGCKYIAEQCSIPCVQLEINYSHRDFNAKYYNVHMLIKSIVNSLKLYYSSI